MYGPAAWSKFTRLRVWVLGLSSGKDAAHGVGWLFVAAQPRGDRRRAGWRQQCGMRVEASWAAGWRRRAASGQIESLKASPLVVELSRRPLPGQGAEASSGRVESAGESPAAWVQAVVLLSRLARRSEA